MWMAGENQKNTSATNIHWFLLISIDFNGVFVNQSDSMPYCCIVLIKVDPSQVYNAYLQAHRCIFEFEPRSESLHKPGHPKFPCRFVGMCHSHSTMGAIDATDHPFPCPFSGAPYQVGGNSAGPVAKIYDMWCEPFKIALARGNSDVLWLIIPAMRIPVNNWMSTLRYSMESQPRFLMVSPWYHTRSPVASIVPSAERHGWFVDYKL